jgi:predicted RNA binding protein YcfA (HicA-like mRNA interferase family)
MTKLQVISGKRLIKILQKVGYFVVRQRGSHIRLHNSNKVKKEITIPSYKIIGRGLLRKILREAELSVSEFNTLSKK